MRRTWLTSLWSGPLVCVLTVAAVLTVGTGDAPPPAEATVLTPARAESVAVGQGEGLGPPPWAHAGGRKGAERGKAAKPKTWKDDWRALTPAQKAQKMASLARAHDEGMRTWTRCVRTAGADQAKRRACEKPLPPGLAKKQA